MRLGILKETKTPVDRRVCLVPEQIAWLIHKFPEHDFYVQSSKHRVFTDADYEALGIKVVRDISHCDALFGVKEIDLENLIPGKTFFFFSHTAKEQPQNRTLLKRSSELGITLIDYEYLKKNSARVIAFGFWAGIVGAYNALIAYGKLTGTYELKPAHQCYDLQEIKAELRKVNFRDSLRIVLTGEGRVASGATEILEEAGVQRVTHERFLEQKDKYVYCQIGPEHYTKHKFGKAFDFQYFIDHPDEFESAFFPFAEKANVFIPCHYWDNRSPVFLTRKQMKDPRFKIMLIADISCDLNGPVPSTLRASTIESPFYGYDIQQHKETMPFLTNCITVMAVDNLPGELPRDSSCDFGKNLMEKVLPELLSGDKSKMIENATILKKGKLTEPFSYLKNYLNG